jgi:NAD(P)-dependent dehydrogenase (short-subunit alcohol dehydrogenase family)
MKKQRYTMSGFYKIKDVQKPIDTGFGAQSTAEEVMAGVNMAGKTAIVTGGYSGIGLETVRALYQCGATVIVPARNVEVVSELFDGYGSRLEIAPMDLMQPDTIDAFADGIIASGRPVHLLINNAGIMAAPLARDARGYESQFATNHLGHFQLTVRLWEGLKRANGARVVTVSSLGHRFSEVNYGDLHF